MFIQSLQYELARTMDSADSETLRTAIRSQGARLNQQDEQLTAVCQGVRELCERHEGFQSSIGNQVCQLANQIQQLVAHLDPPRSAPPLPASDPATAPGPVPATVPTPLPSFPHLSRPERFSGDSDNCCAFLVQCGLHFELQASSFQSERAKVAYIISHLTGRAEAWATAEWARDSPVCNSLRGFTETLSKIFDHTTPGREAARALMDLHQRGRRVSDYAVEFRTLAADSGWNDSSLFDAFRHGLSGPIKDQLAPLELPSDLDSFIAMAIRIDTRLVEREREKSRAVFSPPGQRGQSQASPFFPKQRFQTTDSPAPPTAQEEPMQLGRAKLTPEERQRRLREGRCIYCSQKGHFVASCPVKDQAHQ